MQKSYRPMRPKARKNPPEWASVLLRTNRRTRVETDDVVLENAVATGHPKLKGVVCVAYQDGRGRWCEVEVLRGRIKSMRGVA